MSLLLHLVGVAVFGACTYYDIYYVLENAGPHQDNPLVKELFNSRPQWGGRWKFLTVWGLTVQLIYYVIAAVNDLLGSSTFVRRDGTRLQRLRDLFFTALALPVALVVCLMFWGLYAIHRDLVFPEVMDLFYPWWLNHGVHTMPLLLGLLEVLTVRHHYASNWVSVALLATFLVTYLAWQGEGCCRGEGRRWEEASLRGPPADDVYAVTAVVLMGPSKPRVKSHSYRK
ncbi:androgen-induced gene 1 protein-like isoform X2 [Pollicipes pollicipes]|uniref:androgen-induced gene 1 protein-like isoform X2 n=1 Tax=Pollicipes pollicipes TaxID=41117 RepID=UPI001884AA6D|nr:androgen-induced gene 1 protein-like isoform X2 [Pollicipes pollicipes]